MGNKKTGAPVSKGLQILEDAAHHPGTNPLAMRIVRGALTFAVPGFGKAVVKKPDAGQVGDAQPAVAATEGALDAIHAAALLELGWMKRFSSVALYLSYANPGAGTKATLERYRVLDNGDVVRDGADFVDVANHTLLRDENSGLRTIYRIVDITLDGATAITLNVAGEGLGFED